MSHASGARPRLSAIAGLPPALLAATRHDPFRLPVTRDPAIAKATRGSRHPAGRSRSSRSLAPSRRALRADAGFAQRTINRETRRVGRELDAGEPSRNTSARNAKDIRQPVDRDNEHVLLDSLDAPGANEAHDAERPVACPPSPAPRQPVGLLPHSSDVTRFVRPRLGFDRFLPRGGPLVGSPRTDGPGVHMHLTCSEVDGTHVETTYERNE